MNKKRSKSVRVLPYITEWIVGSIKSTTFRVAKNGVIYASAKVKQPNKQGGDPKLLQSGSVKWGTLSTEQKDFWRQIANENNFWSNWTAFMSSFLLSVNINGLDYTMNNELGYYHSESRLERRKHLVNSVKRVRQCQIDPKDYVRTEETLEQYPVEFDSRGMYIKLLDLIDVNNALRAKVIYRTDTIVKYQYFPEQTGNIEKGYYVRTERPRNDDEFYELISP